MSATNLTDVVTSLINSTRNNSVSGPVSTWETRLQANWQALFAYSLGSVLSILIICISIFSKHITGDYKWFVLNQALANFFQAFGKVEYNLVALVLYTPGEYSRLYSANDPLLWIYIQKALNFLVNTVVLYAQIYTLFTIVFNRWIAIVMPDHYRKFMSARLIVLYCILCYVIALPLILYSDLLYKWNIPPVVIILIVTGHSIIPWLLSIILSASTFFKLWKHMRTTTTITEKKRLQESRMVLYSLMIQIVGLFLANIYQISYLIYVYLMSIEGINMNFMRSFANVISVFFNIRAVFIMYANAYTCIIILITMRPYRRALLSLISQITKFFQHYLKSNVTPRTTDNRVTPKPTVVIVQPAGRAKST